MWQMGVVNADWTLVNRTQLLVPDEVDPTSLGVTIATLVRLPDVLGVGNDIYFGHDADMETYIWGRILGAVRGCIATQHCRGSLDGLSQTASRFTLVMAPSTKA